MKLKNKLAKVFKLPYISNSGYKQHYNPSSPDARKDGYSPIHRDVARKKVGGNIYKNYEVHHIDGNKRNNNINNLIILSKVEHRKRHNDNNHNR